MALTAIFALIASVQAGVRADLQFTKGDPIQRKDLHFPAFLSSFF